jgi:hypothetical protein
MRLVRLGRLGGAKQVVGRSASTGGCSFQHSAMVLVTSIARTAVLQGELE